MPPTGAQLRLDIGVYDVLSETAKQVEDGRSKVDFGEVLPFIHCLKPFRFKHCRTGFVHTCVDYTQCAFAAPFFRLACVCVCVYVMDLRLFMHACWMAAPELKNRQAGFSFVKLTVCVCKHMQTPFYEEILMKTQNPVEICLCIPWAKAHHVLTCFDPACIRRKGRRWRTAWSNETRRDVVQLACVQYFPS